MSDINLLLETVQKGFETLKVDEKYKTQALEFLKVWLSDSVFIDYVPQIEHIINSKDWDYLLDCFYQIIPFGTGGRRGEVGIGPNRINKWTIQASAQGHSQYLINHYGEDAKSRGVVLTYDVRQFFSNKHFSDELPNPVNGLNCKDLAIAAAQTYTANGIKIFMFSDVRTTPELSFAIRYLKAVSGDMFSASHNPPEHNGKKIYDEFGGQLIPPQDEKLVEEVTQNVKEIKVLPYEEAANMGLITEVGQEIDDAYIEAATKLSLSSARDIGIVYTPLHGTGTTSVVKALEKLGFKLKVDPSTSNRSGKFENITFNIPNPEVTESFDTTLKYAKEQNADILLNSDPDADRIGVMIKHNNEWKYINGNEIGVILSAYVIGKSSKGKNKPIIIKTTVTTNLATRIAKENNVEVIGELPVGFKYIGDEMNKLEKVGRIDDFILGLEESHGYIAGNYLRDKDSVIGAIWLSELAAELKKDNKTLIDYLNEIYANYGYYRNYLTEIRLPGAEGMSSIQKIQSTMRETKPQLFGQFQVDKIEDFWDRQPIVSETDRVSKDLLVFHFKPSEGVESMRITLRPSGTEPKIKMYFEIGSTAFDEGKLDLIKQKTELVMKEVEKQFMMHCYKIVGVDFPERGFLLFWQLPLSVKLKYFEIEPEIEVLKSIENVDERRLKLGSVLEFLGSDPIQKVDEAFKAKYNAGIAEYLGI